jgi:hypothetical protein
LIYIYKQPHHQISTSINKASKNTNQKNCCPKFFCPRQTEREGERVREEGSGQNGEFIWVLSFRGEVSFSSKRWRFGGSQDVIGL